MILCAYEDRVETLVGLKLLILSLAEKCPGLKIHIYTPLHDSVFFSWIEKQPHAIIAELPETEHYGWDIKPSILLDMLNKGFDDVVWIDSDIIVNRDFRHTIESLSSETLLAVEEHPFVMGNNNPKRTEYLGLKVGRIFARTINTCVLRITSFHRTLIQEWNRQLQRQDYREAQSQSFDDRPWFLGGDQDLLAGLLGSTDFLHIPVKQLKSGTDVAHCFCGYGYMVKDRIKNLFRGLPDLVHAQGPKPWELPDVLFSELSPYSSIALLYKNCLDEPASWLEIKTALACFLNTFAFGNPNLRDLPTTIFYEARARWIIYVQNKDSQH